MAILASYILPHCPVVIPEIGRGEERLVAKTADGFMRVAEEIASLHPETIVIASPHAESYRDFFQIADGETATGSFRDYEAMQVHFRFHYDDILRKEISRIAANRKFPAGYEGAEDPALDHGTMVPLYFLNKVYSNYKIVRLGLSGLSLLSHYKMGQIIADAAKNTGKRVVFIASGDMSHCLRKDGPYGYSLEGERYEEALNRILLNANFGSLLTMDKRLIRNAKECGHRVFALLAGTLDRKNIATTFYSHEAPFGIGYGVYGYRVLGEDASRAYGDLYVSKTLFSLKEKKEKADEYLKLAYLTLDQYLNHTEAQKIDVSLPLVEKKSGIVISIYESDVLRAQYATIVPTQINVAQEIIQNTVKAAKSDLYFDPIDAKEYPYLDVVVSEVGPLEAITTSKELDVKKYGVLLRCGLKSGYALPEFTYRNSEEQMKAAREAGGIKEKERVSIWRFPLLSHV